MKFVRPALSKNRKIIWHQQTTKSHRRAWRPAWMQMTA